MGGVEEEKEEEEEEYRLECPLINKVQGCYNRTQERALLSSGSLKTEGGQRHRGAVSTRGATSIFTKQFFEDLSPSYSLEMFLSLFLLKVLNPTVLPLAVCSGT